MSDEDINLADPSQGAKILAQWDGISADTRSKELHEHWGHEMDMSQARWIWIQFAKPAWIMLVRVMKRDSENYPAIVAAYDSPDGGKSIISLFEERKIYLAKEELSIEREIPPIYSDNLLLVFPKFFNPGNPYLPTQQEIQIMGYYDA